MEPTNLASHTHTHTHSNTNSAQHCLTLERPRSHGSAGRPQALTTADTSGVSHSLQGPSPRLESATTTVTGTCPEDRFHEHVQAKPTLHPRMIQLQPIILNLLRYESILWTAPHPDPPYCGGPIDRCASSDASGCDVTLPTSSRPAGCHGPFHRLSQPAASFHGLVKRRFFTANL